MHVAARTGSVGSVLGHEGHAQTHLVRDLLQALLVDHMPIRHLQGASVAHVELVLAKPPLALGALHGHAGIAQVTARRSDEALHPSALERVVILDIPPGGLQ